MPAYCLGYFSIFAANGILLPLIPLILKLKGMRPSGIGVLLGSYELCGILGLLVLGKMYDKIKKPKGTLIILFLLTIGSSIAVADISNPALLLPVVLVFGFFIKTPPSILDAHFGQSIPQAPQRYGRIRLFGSLGFFFTAMTVQFTNFSSNLKPLRAAAGFSIFLVLAISAIPFLPRQKENSGQELRQGSFSSILKTLPGQYWFGLILVFMNSVALAGHYTFFSLMLHHRFPGTEIGMFWAIGPLFELPLFFFSRQCLQKLKVRGLWLAALSAGFIRMQVYALAEGLAILYLVQLLHSVTFGFNHLSLVTQVNQQSPRKHRGFAMALYMAIGTGLGLFTGGTLGGLILEQLGFTRLFQILSLFPLAGMGLTFFIKNTGSITRYDV